VLALLVLVTSIAAIDSANPSTVATATFLAVGQRAARDLALFTLGVFAVSTAGGLVLVLGPGRALLAIVSTPSARTTNLLEVVAGGVLIAAAIVLWLTSRRVARRLSTASPRKGSSSLLLGAGIMAVELPTAVPYFGALVAVVEAHPGTGAAIVAVLLYNLVFVSPLLALLLVVAASAKHGARLAADARAWLSRFGPVLVPAAVGLLGLALLAIGLGGLRGAG
jgi:cytochrome c biogenesis protein CcdA